jgi:hypothetical protein
MIITINVIRLLIVNQTIVVGTKLIAQYDDSTLCKKRSCNKTCSVPFFYVLKNRDTRYSAKYNHYK